MRSYARSLQGTLAVLTALLQETVQGNRVVKAFNMQGYEKRRFADENRSLFRMALRVVRIRAAVPMAGQLAPFPGGEYDPSIGPPVLIIHGDVDDTVPYSSATEAYDLLLPPKLLLTHLGGGHVSPYVGSRSAPAVAATIESSIAFFDHFLKHERGARERLLDVGTRAGVVLEYDLGR